MPKEELTPEEKAAIAEAKKRARYKRANEKAKEQRRLARAAKEASAPPPPAKPARVTPKKTPTASERTDAPKAAPKAARKPATEPNPPAVPQPEARAVPEPARGEATKGASKKQATEESASRANGGAPTTDGTITLAEVPTLEDTTEAQAERLVLTQLLEDDEPPTALPKDITWHPARNPHHMGATLAATFSQWHTACLAGERADDDAAADLLTQRHPLLQAIVAKALDQLAVDGRPGFDDQHIWWLIGSACYAVLPLVSPTTAGALAAEQRRTHGALSSNRLAQRIVACALVTHWRELRRLDDQGELALPATQRAAMRKLLGPLLEAAQD